MTRRSAVIEIPTSIVEMLAEPWADLDGLLARHPGPDALDVLIHIRARCRETLAEAELPSGPCAPVDRDLKPGHRVSYTAYFLSTIGSHPGSELDRAGRVVEVLHHLGKRCVRVAWDDGSEGVTAYDTVARVGFAATFADSPVWRQPVPR